MDSLQIGADDWSAWGKSCLLVLAASLSGLVSGVRAESATADLPAAAQASSLETFRFSGSAEVPREGLKLREGQALVLAEKMSGPTAVYLSVVVPSPEMVSEAGGRSLAIAANDRYYHAIKSRHPFVSTISGGRLFAKNALPAGERVSQEVYAGWVNFPDETLTVKTVSGEVLVTQIRLQPLTAEQAALAAHRNDPTGNRRIIYNNDGFSLGFGVPGWDVRNFLSEQVDMYKGTDAQQLDWGTLCTAVASYPSKAVDWFGDGVPKWSREFERLSAENFRKLEAIGMPLYPSMVKRGQEIGVPVWGSLNMSAYYGEHPFGDAFNGKLYREHPEYRIKLKDGSFKGGRAEMSMAYPAVREQRLGVPVELAEMGCEGVNLDFCRYPEVLGYDDPLLESFSAKYGEDARQLREDDPRWVAHRCEFMTEYLRELKRRLAKIAAKRGKPVGLSIRLPATDYKSYGLDPQTWIAEGLVDVLIPGYPGFEMWFDAAPWVAMVKSSPVKVYPNIEHFIHETSQSELTDEEVARGVKEAVQTRMSLEDYLRRAADLYAAGADGLNLFNNFGPRPPITLDQLGDRENVRRWSVFEDRLKLGSEVVKFTP